VDWLLDRRARDKGLIKEDGNSSNTYKEALIKIRGLRASRLLASTRAIPGFIPSGKRHCALSDLLT
jgi:hypothetical protein